MSDGLPLLQLNNGVTMPALGFGTYQASPDEAARAVATALATGYRLIDTAAAYFNEQAVGEAIRASDIPRDAIFVTTKLRIGEFGFDEALRGFDASQTALGLDRIDLYLLHWPVPSRFDRTIAAWRALERLLDEGRVRAIGVSNFRVEDLDALAAATDIRPAVNQIELHPRFNQRDLRTAHAERGIVTQSWSPIGGIAASATGHIALLDDAVINAIALRHERSPAQITLRWHLQHGLSAIPKSVTPERIAANIDLVDFILDTEEMTMLDALDNGLRSGPDPLTAAPA